jgi:ribosomal protein S18 acetylase RimI-like enzyme
MITAWETRNVRPCDGAVKEWHHSPFIELRLNGSKERGWFTMVILHVVVGRIMSDSVNGSDDARSLSESELEHTGRQVSELLGLSQEDLVPLAPPEVESILRNGRSIVAMEGDLVVGFVWLRSWGDWPEGRPVFEVRSLVVHPAFRCRGLGITLHREISRIGRACSRNVLIIGTVRAHNEIFCQWLLRHGAREITRPPILPSRVEVLTFDVGRLAGRWDVPQPQSNANCEANQSHTSDS